MTTRYRTTKSRAITIRLTQLELEDLRRRAAILGTTASALARVIIAAEVADCETRCPTCGAVQS